MSEHRELRILSLAPTSFFNDYGCHVRILEEALALQRRGHAVTLLTYFKGQDVAGVRIIRTRPTPWHADYEVGSSKHKYAFDALLALRLLGLLWRSQRDAATRYDLIHGHLHEGGLIGKVIGRPFGIPVFMDYQGSLTEEMRQHGFLRPNGVRERIWRLVEDLAERMVDGIFTSTAHAASRLHRQDGASVVALPDGVNTDVVKPGLLPPDERARRRARYGIAPDAPVAVFLGLLAPHQGIQNILDAAALLKPARPELRWLVMGYPAQELWRSRAAQRGVDGVVRFTGRVPYADMPGMLALGDVAVAPKLTISESSGKLLNYMAAGLPTVAFDTPAQRELLGECGLYAPVGDSTALADGVAKLLDNPGLAMELGGAARIRAQHEFSWDRAADTLERRYFDVVRTR